MSNKFYLLLFVFFLFLIHQKVYGLGIREKAFYLKTHSLLLYYLQHLRYNTYLLQLKILLHMIQIFHLQFHLYSNIITESVFLLIKILFLMLLLGSKGKMFLEWDINEDYLVRNQHKQHLHAHHKHQKRST